MNRHRLTSGTDTTALKRPGVPLWHEGYRCAWVAQVHTHTHTLPVYGARHTDSSRDYNYRDSHNVASRYAASVIASPVATWQQRSLATAGARCGVSGPASPPSIPTSEYSWEGKCSQKTLAGVFSLSRRRWQLTVLKEPAWALIWPLVRTCPMRAADRKAGFLKTLPISLTG